MKIESIEYRIELFLSIAAFIPGVGAFKVAGGIIQVVCGLATAIIFALPSLCSDPAHKLMTRGVSHIVHGMGNIFVGIFEAIPVVGLLILIVRNAGKHTENEEQFHRKVYLTSLGNDKFSISSSETSLIGEYFSRQPGKFIVYEELLKDQALFKIIYDKTDPNKGIKQLRYLKFLDTHLPVKKLAPYWIAC